ncbi:MAG: hypothetical protein ACREE6_06385 [Limisphaerales bacterium]
MGDFPRVGRNASNPGLKDSMPLALGRAGNVEGIFSGCGGQSIHIDRLLADPDGRIAALTFPPAGVFQSRAAITDWSLKEVVRFAGLIFERGQVRFASLGKPYVSAFSKRQTRMVAGLHLAISGIRFSGVRRKEVLYRALWRLF